MMVSATRALALDGRSPSVDRTVTLLMLLGDKLADRGGPGISINAMARSLGFPFETVRRHVAQLADRGIVIRRDDGIALSTAYFESEPCQALCDRIHDAMIRFLEHLTLLDIELPATTRPALDWRQIAAECCALVVAEFDVIHPMFKHPTAMFIQFIATTLSVRELSFDTALSHDFADPGTPPSDALRGWVPISQLAQLSGVSYATARRYVAELIAQGRLERRGSRVRAPIAFLQSAELLEAHQLTIYRLRRSLQRLGLSTGTLPAYRRERPSLIGMG